MILTEDECFAALADDITEIEETRACEEEWTVIVAMCRAIEAAVIAKLAQGVEMPEAVGYQYLFHHHDGGNVWRDSVEKWNVHTAIEHRPIYTADQLRTCIAAARVQAINECASELDGMKCNNNTATSAIKQCAEAIRALKGGAV